MVGSRRRKMLARDIEIVEDAELLVDKLDAERAGFTW